MLGGDAMEYFTVITLVILLLLIISIKKYPPSFKSSGYFLTKTLEQPPTAVALCVYIIPGKYIFVNILL